MATGISAAAGGVSCCPSLLKCSLSFAGCNFMRVVGEKNALSGAVCGLEDSALSGAVAAWKFLH